MSVKTTIVTPCVGICSTGIGDQVCRGCKRFDHEVIDWNRYSDEQRQIVLQRLDDFLTKIISRKFLLVNEAKFSRSIEYQNILVRAEQSIWSQIYLLLRAGATQIQDIGDYGIALQSPWDEMPLADVKKAIEEEFLSLSSAYHERYFAISH